MEQILFYWISLRNIISWLKKFPSNILWLKECDTMTVKNLIEIGILPFFFLLFSSCSSVLFEHDIAIEKFQIFSAPVRWERKYCALSRNWKLKCTLYHKQIPIKNTKIVWMAATAAAAAATMTIESVKKVRQQMEKIIRP